MSSTSPANRRRRHRGDPDPMRRGARAVAAVGFAALGVFAAIVVVAVVPTLHDERVSFAAAAGTSSRAATRATHDASGAAPATAAPGTSNGPVRPVSPIVPRLVAPATPADAVPVAPAPSAAGSGGSAGAGVDAAALAEPAANTPPDPDFLDVCAAGSYDDSTACVDATVTAISNARAVEGVGPLVLPASWDALTPAEQLFVATNLERTARGLPPMQAMTASLDAAAASGASSGQDPVPPAGLDHGPWVSNWGASVGNPLEVVYLWMYDDGPGGYNLDCASSGAGCWDHRNNVLAELGSDLTMGAGYDVAGWNGTPAWAEILVSSAAASPVDFTWSQVVDGGS